MERESNTGSMVVNFLATMNTQKKKAKAVTCGQMVTDTLEIGKRMSLKDTEHTSGLTVECTLADGLTIS